jgi:hypothetical protein
VLEHLGLSTSRVPIGRNASVKRIRSSVSFRMSSKLVIGHRWTKAAVNATMLGGSGWAASGVRRIRPLPVLLATIFTWGLVRRLASKAASAAVILLRTCSTNVSAARGCPRVA